MGRRCRKPLFFDLRLLATSRISLVTRIYIPPEKMFSSPPTENLSLAGLSRPPRVSSTRFLGLGGGRFSEVAWLRLSSQVPVKH